MSGLSSLNIQKKPFPYRRRGQEDFGQSRFGRHPKHVQYQGRSVDILGRSIPCEEGQTPQDCVRKWLDDAKTTSAREIAKRPVVVIHPEAASGTVIWNGTDS